MEDLHKVIRNIKSIHNPTCLETISKFNHDNWIHDFCTLPFTEKINYDTSTIFKNHKLKVNFNMFYGGLSIVNELKFWDCLIKPLSGKIYYYTFVDKELQNKTVIPENIPNIILKEYDNENYLFENDEQFPVYTLNFYDKTNSNDR